MYTTIAVNKGNYLGISDAFSVPILTDVVIQEQEIRGLLNKTHVPAKKVIKVERCWTEVKDVRIKILKGRIFLTGLAYQYKILISENNIAFCELIADQFSITSSVKDLTPETMVKWQVRNREYTKILTPCLISYLNELTFNLQVIHQKTLWVKTRAVGPLVLPKAP